MIGIRGGDRKGIARGPLTPGAASATIRAMEVLIERLVHRGMGLGRVDGRAWMIPLTAPGDRVEADPVRQHPGHVEGRLRAVLDPGPDRVAPPCPVYGRCGGCQLQHLDPARQPDLKAAVLRDVLTRLGKVELPDVEVRSGDPWAYRCRVELHGGPTPRGVVLGFHGRGSHDVVEPPACPIARPEVSRLLPVLRQALRDLRPAGPVEVEPVCGDDGGVVVVARGAFRDAGAAAKALAGLPGVSGAHVQRRPGPPRWTSAGTGTVPFPTADGRGGRTSLAVDPRGFTQANLALNPVLADTVLELAAVTAGTRVLELFAGAGNLTVPLAGAGAVVAAVEVNGEALQQAGAALAARGLSATLQAGRVERIAAGVMAGARAGAGVPEVLVADPPRTGMGVEAARALADLPARRAVIVSCDPATLARDLQPFREAGWRLDRVVMIDLFPQTFHLETVVRLARG